MIWKHHTLWQFFFPFCCPVFVMSLCFREKEREGIETILPITTKPGFWRRFFYYLASSVCFTLQVWFSYQNLRKLKLTFMISPRTSLLKSGKRNFVTRPIPSGLFSKMKVCLGKCQFMGPSLESIYYHHDHQRWFTLIMHFCDHSFARCSSINGIWWLLSWDLLPGYHDLWNYPTNRDWTMWKFWFVTSIHNWLGIMQAIFGSQFLCPPHTVSASQVWL